LASERTEIAARRKKLEILAHEKHKILEENAMKFIYAFVQEWRRNRAGC
jgi:hypothetical protein